jgi:dihydrofolate synthase/folylpolyglutamate synthase
MELYERLYRLHRFGIRPGLERITALLDAVGQPQRDFACVHVTGTNGKGSVCALIASMLRAQGYRVGLYTSPHLLRFAERIRIDGVPVAEELVLELLPEVLERGEALGATFFEVTTALAFQVFSALRVQIAVVEVGMGGRYDATNVVEPLVAVITGIDADHREYLGRTLHEIAWQKVGIVKPGVVLVLGERRPWLRRTLLQWAQELGARAVRPPQRGVRLRAEHADLTQCVRLPDGSEVRLPLAGEHQRRNLALALAVMEELQPHFPTDWAQRRRGIEAVRRWGGLRARIELLRATPPVVVDVAHNAAGIAALCRTLQRHGYGQTRWTVVFGVMADKDVTRMLALLQPITAELFACAPTTERALPTPALASVARRLGMSVREFADVPTAVQAALERGGPLLVVGSFYLLAEALPLLEPECVGSLP